MNLLSYYNAGQKLPNNMFSNFLSEKSAKTPTEYSQTEYYKNFYNFICDQANLYNNQLTEFYVKNDLSFNKSTQINPLNVFAELLENLHLIQPVDLFNVAKKILDEWTDNKILLIENSSLQEQTSDLVLQKYLLKLAEFRNIKVNTCSINTEPLQLVEDGKTLVMIDDATYSGAQKGLVIENISHKLLHPETISIELYFAACSKEAFTNLTTQEFVEFKDLKVFYEQLLPSYFDLSKNTVDFIYWLQKRLKVSNGQYEFVNSDYELNPNKTIEPEILGATLAIGIHKVPDGMSIPNLLHMLFNINYKNYNLIEV